MRAVLPLLFICLPLAASGAKGPPAIVPFELAHAADQEQITSRALMEELDQFRAIFNWHRSQALLSVARARLEKAKGNWERHVDLSRNKYVSESALSLSFSRYQKLLTEISRLELEVENDRGVALVHKWRMIEEGNSGADYRQQIASALAQGMAASVESLNRSLDAAIPIRDTAKAQYESGLRLKARKLMTSDDVDLRELTLKEAQSQVDLITTQIAVSEKAGAAFAENRNRLSQPLDRKSRWTDTSQRAN